MSPSTESQPGSQCFSLSDSHPRGDIHGAQHHCHPPSGPESITGLASEPSSDPAPISQRWYQGPKGRHGGLNSRSLKRNRIQDHGCESGQPSQAAVGWQGGLAERCLVSAPLGQYDRILSATLVKVHTPNISDPYGDKGSHDGAEWVTKSKGSKH